MTLEGEQGAKNCCPSHKLWNSVFPSWFFMKLWSRNPCFDNITVSYRKNTSMSVSVYLRSLYNICTKNIIPLLCQYGLFINIFMYKNVIVSKDAIFYYHWYNMVPWSSHIYTKSCFLSFHGLLFIVNNTEEVIQWNQQSVTRVEWNGMENTIMQVPYFLNGLMASLLSYFREKVTS